MHEDKLVVWLHGEIKTPPFSAEARIEAGCLLRRLQHGELLGLPHARPMPVVGARCHELRVKDKGAEWPYYLPVGRRRSDRCRTVWEENAHHAGRGDRQLPTAVACI